MLSSLSRIAARRSSMSGHAALRSQARRRFHGSSRRARRHWSFPMAPMALAAGGLAFVGWRLSQVHADGEGEFAVHCQVAVSDAYVAEQLAAADRLFDAGVDSVDELHQCLVKLAGEVGVSLDRVQDAGAEPEVIALVPMPKTVSQRTLANLLWRLSRAKRLMTQDPQADWKARETNARMCHALAALAVAADDSVWEAHKWLGISYSVLGDFLGVKAKLQNAFLIRDEFERAVALYDGDATTQHLLGYWFFYFAEMSWLERNLAATLFSNPPEGSYELALKWLSSSARLDPTYVRNCYYLSLVNARLGKAEQAAEWKKHALEAPVVSRDDQEFHDLALKL